ncbi:hypothetical protein GS462_26905 [Rhodococcus hoagii]|nr:hypothetical protein [Prescottella equi]
MSPYELAERLVEYARTHFSALDADHIEMMFGVGEFDLTVDGFSRRSRSMWAARRPGHPRQD